MAPASFSIEQLFRLRTQLGITNKELCDLAELPEAKLRRARIKEAVLNPPAVERIARCERAYTIALEMSGGDPIAARRWLRADSPTLGKSPLELAVSVAGLQRLEGFVKDLKAATEKPVKRTGARSKNATTSAPPLQKTPSPPEIAAQPLRPLETPPESDSATKKWRVKERLQPARENATPKLTQSALAAKVAEMGIPKITASRISQLEHGYADATWPELQAIARALNVTPDWLASISAETKPAPGLAKKTQQSQPAIATGMSASSVNKPTPIVPSVALVNPPAPEAQPKIAPEDIPPALPLQGSTSNLQYHQELTALLVRAEKKLHQSGLPAAPWRAWRAFAGEIRETIKKISI